MANEFKHKDPCTTLTQAEYISACGDGHIFACQATGDILYASSSTVLSKLAKGAANTVLSMGGSCIPAWTASPSVTDLTIGGGCITLSAATDIDLLDNNASALSFDASGKTGIIDIVTTNCSEGVTMSGTLGVTGVLTATGGIELSHACQNTLTGSGGCVSVNCNVIYRAGGTDVAVADGGTGASSLTDGGILLGSGTSAITAMAVLADGEMIVGDGTTDPVAESGATLRTSIGVGTGDSPQFTGIELGHASDTTIVRSSSGDITIEGNVVYRAGGTDVAVADGGTGASTLTCGGILLGSGTGAITAMSVLAAGAIVKGDGSGDPVALARGSANQVLTTKCCDISWEDAAGGSARSVAGDTDNGIITWVTSDNTFAAEANLLWDAATMTMKTAGTASTGLLIETYTTSNYPARINLRKSNNGSIGSHTALEADEILGAIDFTASDGDSFELGARIRVDSVCDAWASDNRGTKMRFYTTPNGSTSEALALTLSSTGQVLHGNGAVCAPSISFASDTDNGFWMPGANNFRAVTNGIDMFNVHEANGGWNIEFGDTSNSKGDRQMTLNQGCKDNEIFALKSSDVAHGMTCITETDTYGVFKKTCGANGSLQIESFSDTGAIGLDLAGTHVTDNTTKSTVGVGSVRIRAYKKNGTTRTTVGADTNLLSIQNSGTARFLFDAEGTAHADVGTATYDDYCDVELLRGMLATTCDQYKQNYMDRFGKDLMYNQQWYEDNKIIGKCSIHYETRECGRVQQRAMINFTGLTMLHHSTIIQLADNLNARIDGLETQLKALQGGCL
jgi:hypothetical protein